MRKILITIDHKWRDLPGYVLLGEYLSKMGLKVVYCRNGLEKYYLHNEHFDIVLVNHIFEKSRQNLIKEYSLSGVKFVILPTEGIPVQDDYTDFAMGVDLDYSDISCYVAWSSFNLDGFNKNRTFDPQRVYVSGVPRFDFYKQFDLAKFAFFNYFSDTSSTKILWATNFTQAQFYTGNKFGLMETDALKLGYKKTFERMQGSLKKVAEKDYLARQQSTKIILECVQSNPDIQLVIKPHPSEDAEFYDKTLKEYNISDRRVKVIKDHYIWDLLQWCDVEVSRSCTTAVEAWHLQKPTIDLNPDKSWYHSAKHSLGSYECSNYFEFDQALKECLTPKWEPPKSMYEARIDFINTYCEGSSHFRTHSLAKKILELSKNNPAKFMRKRFNLKSALIYFLLRYFNHFPHSMKVYGISYLFGNRVDKLGRKDKHFHNSDIVEWKRLLSGEL